MNVFLLDTDTAVRFGIYNFGKQFYETRQNNNEYYHRKSKNL